MSASQAGVRKDFWCIDGEGFTKTNALSIQKIGELKLKESDTLSVDFSRLSQVDSSAVAVMVSWTRTAFELKKELIFIGLPDNLTALVSLYEMKDAWRASLG
jgi:phospholipid transport system transporter-binding protein